MSTTVSTAIPAHISPLAQSGPAHFHPLDPLTPAEITLASDIVRRHVAENTPIKALKFVASFTVEPPKLDVLAFLGIPTAPGAAPAPKPAKLDRKAEVHYIGLVEGTAFTSTVLLSSPTSGSVLETTQLPEGTQPALTIEELVVAEEALRKHPEVVKLAREVGVDAHQLYADGWSIGYDDRFPSSLRVQQCLLYARFGPDDNQYAHPMDFFPVLNSNTYEVLAIDFAAHRTTPKGALSSSSTRPAALGEDGLKQSGRERIPPPLEPFDYLPDLMAQKKTGTGAGWKERDDLKPLNITQPEGVSFTMEGNQISWQKWKLHIGFHYREGIVLSTVTYNDDGNVRPVFYRMGLAEMVVPYGAPEYPHPRKFAFDVGEYGLGVLANELSLGCDCKGVIHYLPGAFVGHDGKPTIVKQAICIHEEDAGLLYKHADYRPGGRAVSVRSRKLVISQICTVANYEYAIYWNFYQDGNVELEIRLTGILNLYVLGQGEKPNGFGTEVAPRINAHYHQHLFSLRVDPMIDGVRNTIVETDVVPVEAPTGSAENFAGNAFTTRKTVLSTTAQGAREFDGHRIWSIVNENKLHYASGQPIGYKVMCKDMPPLLAKPDSWVATRAPFATKQLWVAPSKPDQLYPAGKYVPQTRSTPKDSILAFTAGNQSIRNEDIAAWFTFGVTHIPRPEDFPVMPVEHCRLMFKPAGFFDQNPALDVPSSADLRSQYAVSSASCCTPQSRI